MEEKHKHVKCAQTHEMLQYLNQIEVIRVK